MYCSQRGVPENKTYVKALVILLQVYCVASQTASRNVPLQEACQAITVPICQNLPYKTTMPNIFGHSRQSDTSYDLNRFGPLIDLNCAPELRSFVCYAYLPVCTILETPLLPCRSLCLASKKGCQKVMTQFGIPWPDILNCDQFPSERPCVNGGFNQQKPHALLKAFELLISIMIALSASEMAMYI